MLKKVNHKEAYSEMRWRSSVSQIAIALKRGQSHDMLTSS